MTDSAKWMVCLLAVTSCGWDSIAQAAGLDIRMHDEFDKVWDDGGSGAAMDGSFWRPKNIPPGYFILGHIAQSGHGIHSSANTRLVQGDASQLATPTGLTWVYDDSGSGARGDVTLYRPVCPNGYRGLGLLAFPHSSHRKALVEDFPNLRCVRNDLVAPGTLAEMVWNDRKSGGTHDVSIWNVVPTDRATQFSPGLFTAHLSHGRPPVSNLYVLKRG